MVDTTNLIGTGGPLGKQTGETSWAEPAELPGQMGNLRTTSNAIKAAARLRVRDHLDRFTPVVPLPRTLILGIAVAIVGFGSAPPGATAKRGCGTFHLNDGAYGEVSVRVNVLRGEVTCRRAKMLARRMFRGEGCYHYTGVTGSSYYRIGDWRGNGHMEEWFMWKPGTRARIGGTYRIGGDGDGSGEDAGEC